MTNKSLQFIVGYFVLLILLLILNFVLVEIMPVGETKLIGINENIFLYRLVTSKDYISFEFGSLFFILPLFGGILNLLFSNYINKSDD